MSWRGSSGRPWDGLQPLSRGLARVLRQHHTPLNSRHAILQDVRSIGADWSSLEQCTIRSFIFQLNFKSGGKNPSEIHAA